MMFDRGIRVSYLAIRALPSPSSESAYSGAALTFKISDVVLGITLRWLHLWLAAIPLSPYLR